MTKTIAQILAFLAGNTGDRNRKISIINQCGILILLLLLNTGCSRLKIFQRSTNIDFNIQVKEQTAGTYQVTGEIDLPGNNEIAVAAVRYLKLENSQSQVSKSKLTYAILDYQLVPVKNRKWDVTLNLWKTTKDGQPQEIWQLDKSRLGLSVQPVKDVIFFSTLVPVGEGNQLRNLEQKLAEHNFKIDQGLIHTLASGEQYLQVSQKQEIPAPPGLKVASSVAEEINGGWGDRFLMPPESVPPYRFEFPEERKTNAPTKPEEFLR